MVKNNGDKRNPFETHTSANHFAKRDIEEAEEKKKEAEDA